MLCLGQPRPRVAFVLAIFCFCVYSRRVYTFGSGNQEELFRNVRLKQASRLITKDLEFPNTVIEYLGFNHYSI